MGLAQGKMTVQESSLAVKQPFGDQKVFRDRPRFRSPARSAIATFLSVALLSLNFGVSSVQAVDPFRSTNPRKMGDRTETAFKAIFVDGNYPQAQQMLQQAKTSEPHEPLVYAMLASLAYIEQDLPALKTYGTQTRQKAEALIAADPLRGNLYTAVGYFLEGAANLLQQDNLMQGVPQALNTLQRVFQSFQQAEKIDATDPELNLLKGYMDLMLAVNLPFANPQDAIARLEKNAAPPYLAYRGIAIAYRDLDQLDKAQDYVDRAIAQTPDQPELHYLKAQILQKLKQRQAAQTHFQKALTKPDRLPKTLVAQIFYETCKNQNRLDQKQRNCDALRDPIRKQNGTWGPQQLPPLN